MHDILQHDIIKYGVNEPIHLLSLGAGVQSSTLALMAARGEVKGYPQQIHGAIFADTQDEPNGVYEWLLWLEHEICRSPYPFPLYRVTAGRLSDHITRLHTTEDGRTVTRGNIPVYTLEDGQPGQMPSRACTVDFKIKPVQRKAKELAGVTRGQKTISVIQWIGISLDEVHRMKPSQEKWCENVWPLVDMRMTRHDCLLWMQRNGYPKPPRSSCVFCPYHSNAEWRRLRDEEPEAFAAAVEFEKRLQETKAATDNMRAVPYLHRSLVPLDKVDLSTLEDHGQMSLFGNECTGMCGV